MRIQHVADISFHGLTNILWYIYCGIMCALEVFGYIMLGGILITFCLGLGGIVLEGLIFLWEGITGGSPIWLIGSLMFIALLLILRWIIKGLQSHTARENIMPVVEKIFVALLVQLLVFLVSPTLVWVAGLVNQKIYSLVYAPKEDIAKPSLVLAPKETTEITTVHRKEINAPEKKTQEQDIGTSREGTAEPTIAQQRARDTLIAIQRLREEGHRKCCEAGSRYRCDPPPACRNTSQ